MQTNGKDDKQDIGIIHRLEERNLLPDKQYGFRKNRRPMCLVITLEKSIAESFLKRQSTAMISADISKAHYMC
jgi:hypothetical protein